MFSFHMKHLVCNNTIWNYVTSYLPLYIATVLWLFIMIEVNITTDAPADNTQPVDHGRVRVSADDRVGVQGVGVGEHHSPQVLEVDLVHDSGARRHNQHVPEGLGSPLQV